MKQLGAFMLTICVVACANASGVYSTDQVLAYLEKIQPSVDTTDETAFAASIRLIVLNEDPISLPLLKALWNDGSVRNQLKHSTAIESPIVRLVVAEELLRRDVENKSEYESYILSQAESRDWKIRSQAADSLAVVSASKALDVLYAVARTPHQIVALHAVDSLRQIGRKSGVSSARVRQDVLLVLGELRTEWMGKDSKVSSAIDSAMRDLAVGQ